MCLADKSGTVTEQVQSGIFSSNFNDCFERNFLTVSPNDSIFPRWVHNFFGSFFYCWKVLSSPYSIEVAQGF
jgi:hypothetical protein